MIIAPSRFAISYSLSEEIQLTVCGPLEIDLEPRRGNLHIARKIRDDDMEHRVPELVEFATTVMTLLSGDIIACGTNHEGLGALQDGETVEVEIQGIGRMSLNVADPLKRKWERGVYMGSDSTHPEAIRRHRPNSP